MDPIYTELIHEIKAKQMTASQLTKLKRQLCLKYNTKKPPTNFEILLNASPSDRSLIQKKILVKPVRTASGVSPVAIMTAPFACSHGKCTFCPGGPNSYYGNVPQSYTGHEPTTMRAIRNNYDAYLQVFNRLEQYVALGHNHDKIELIVMGGTFPSMPVDYQNGFIRDAFAAMNDFSMLFYKDGELLFEKFKDFFELPGDVGSSIRTEHIHAKLLELKRESATTLLDEQIRNETSQVRCVALCIETKSDWGFFEHGNRMLDQGCTRVKLVCNLCMMMY